MVALELPRNPVPPREAHRERLPHHRAYPDLEFASSFAEALDGAQVVALLTEMAPGL